MKKWQKVIICVVCAVAVLAIGGSSIYRYYIVPKYLEPMLVEAGKILNDEDIKKEMIVIAKELVDKGMVDSRTLQEYIAANNVDKDTQTSSDKKEQNASIRNKNADDTDNRKSSSSAKNNSLKNNAEDDKNEMKQNSELAKSDLGIENIKVNNESIRKKYSYNNNTNNVETEIASEAEVYNGDKNSSENKGDKELAELAKNSGQSLFNKVMSAMTKEEREKAIDIGMKIDQDRAISLLETDKSELKKYLQSILTEQEYADGVNLYLKYSYLLEE